MGSHSVNKGNRPSSCRLLLYYTVRALIHSTHKRVLWTRSWQGLKHTVPWHIYPAVHCQSSKLWLSVQIVHYCHQISEFWAFFFTISDVIFECLSLCLCFFFCISGQDDDACKVLVLSYPQYCRYRSVLARLREQPSSLLIDHTVLALGGIAALGGNTRILYCRDTFEHPALLQNESICDEFGEFWVRRQRLRRDD